MKKGWPKPPLILAVTSSRGLEVVLHRERHLTVTGLELWFTGHIRVGIRRRDPGNEWVAEPARIDCRIQERALVAGTSRRRSTDRHLVPILKVQARFVISRQIKLRVGAIQEV